MKSSEPFIYHQSFLIMGYKWLSIYSDTFSMVAPQFELTGLLGTFDSRLRILSSKYNFPILQVFLNSKRKHLNSFSVMSCLCFKLSNNLLLFPVKLGIKCLSKFTSSSYGLSLNCFSAYIIYSLRSQITTQDPLSAFFMAILPTLSKERTAFHSSLKNLNILENSKTP